MAAGKVVAWAAAMIRVGDRLVQVPRGAAVPPGADPKHVKLLEQRGAIVKGEPASGVSAPAGRPPFTAEDPTPPADDKPADGKPADGKPADGKPADGKPADS